MSYAQGILKAVAGKSLTAETCSRLIRALDAIPEVFHADFLTAYFNEQAPEEKPEDYAVVKTFTSSDFHVGDEVVVCNDRKGVYLATDTIIGSCLLMDSGELACYFDKDAWTRTGRNFPAIPAIMEELKKG